MSAKSSSSQVGGPQEEDTETGASQAGGSEAGGTPEGGSQASDARPSDARPSGAGPGDTQPSAARPSDTQPIDTPPSGPRLKTGVPVLHLRGGAVQVGTASYSNLILNGLSEKDAAWVDSLRDPDAAPPTNPTQRSVAQALRNAGLLTSTPPEPLRVRMLGLGRVGVLTALACALDGVTYLDLRDGRPVDASVETIFPADMKGVPRDQALRQWASRNNVYISRLREPHLAVTFDYRVQDWETATRLLASDIPQLPVVMGDREVSIGPLSVPGVTACFLCVDAARREILTEWADLRIQLAKAGPNEPSHSLSASAAGLTAGLIRTLADPQGQPDNWYADRMWTVDSTGVTETLWPRRPDCGCSHTWMVT